MKKRYIVAVREVHVRHYSVRAENEEEAKDLVHRQAGSAVDMGFEEYSHCLGRETWTAEEVPDGAGPPGRRGEGAQP